MNEGARVLLPVDHARRPVARAHRLDGGKDPIEIVAAVAAHRVVAGAVHHVVAGTTEALAATDDCMQRQILPSLVVHV